jgi:hypothetical protein
MLNQNRQGLYTRFFALPADNDDCSARDVRSEAIDVAGERLPQNAQVEHAVPVTTIPHPNV